ncbi:MAG: RNA 3'-terminal phosphate cyclase [Nanoarchaeota archaeon]|nr:RNA 3'-terminal phosphate cyclase [Nanoarchaeota archaeon]
MIHIDASDGGGQILRTALGLSVLTGKPCTIENIRKNRPKPGLREQHLKGVLAMLELSKGEVSGAALDSDKIVFNPKTIGEGEIKVEIDTAGSVGLILQTILIPAVDTELIIEIKGGATFGNFAPPMSHFNHVLFPLLKKMGYEVSSEIHHHGFYPKGGARLDVTSNKAKLKPLNINDKGKIKSIKIFSIASKKLVKKEVAERQAEKAKELLSERFSEKIQVVTKYVDSLNLGSGIQIVIETENSILGGDAVGEKDKSSEKIAEKAVKSIIRSYDNGTVDVHTADMLLPYIAIAGGSYTTPQMTNHIKSNIKVIELFLGKKFNVKGRTISVN